MLKISILLSFLVISACSHTVDFSKPSQSDAGLANIEPINIGLNKNLIGLTETTTSMGFKTTAVVGDAMKLVFDGTEENGSLGYLHSLIDVSSSDVLLFGSRYTCNYRLSVSLDRNGSKQSLSAYGFGNSMLGPEVATQTAIEEAVIDLYKQVSYKIGTP